MLLDARIPAPTLLAPRFCKCNELKQLSPLVSLYFSLPLPPCILLSEQVIDTLAKTAVSKQSSERG